jgi:oligoribonuclease
VSTDGTAASGSTGPTPSKDRIVWVDCEMTGLSLQHDALVEIAALVTDGELTVLGEGVDVVIRPPDAALAQMRDVVREMHTSSGLLDVLAEGTTLADAQEQVLAYVRRFVPDARKAPLAGSSVGTDRAFLARDMPELDDHLHYRVVDVSSIKELVRRWYPRVHYNAPQKHGGHRAMADIVESIAELRFYREVVFVPAPGPDSDQVRAIAPGHDVPAGSVPSWAPGLGASAAPLPTGDETVPTTHDPAEAAGSS